MSTSYKPKRVSSRRGRVLAIAMLSCLATAAVAWAAAGNLDTSFSGGVVVTSANGVAPGSAIQSDGKIVVCGAQTISGGSAWMIRRFNADGTDDSMFGTGGVVSLFGVKNDVARRVAIDASGRLLVVGKTSSVVTGKRSTTTTYHQTLVRLYANGTRDTSFGSNGEVRVAPPGSTGMNSNADCCLVTQPDDSIVVAGRAFFSADKRGTIRAQPFLARYGSGGALDTSFGSSGFSIDTRAGEDTTQIWALARQTTGHHVLAQRRNSVTWVITRYLPSGAVDTGFSPILATGDYMGGLAVDGSNRIVATGRNTYSSGGNDILVRRYTSSGGVDESFGSAGRALVHAYSNNGTCWADPVFQPADGKIVLGVNVASTSSGYTAAATVRLLDDGSPDGTYGAAGIGDRIDPFGLGGNASAVGLALDGRILVTGLALGSTGWNWMLARFDAN